MLSTAAAAHGVSFLDDGDGTAARRAEPVDGSIHLQPGASDVDSRGSTGGLFAMPATPRLAKAKSIVVAPASASQISAFGSSDLLGAPMAPSKQAAEFEAVTAAASGSPGGSAIKIGNKLLSVFMGFTAMDKLFSAKPTAVAKPELRGPARQQSMFRMPPAKLVEASAASVLNVPHADAALAAARRPRPALRTSPDGGGLMPMWPTAGTRPLAAAAGAQADDLALRKRVSFLALEPLDAALVEFVRQQSAASGSSAGVRKGSKPSESEAPSLVRLPTAADIAEGGLQAEQRELRRCSTSGRARHELQLPLLQPQHSGVGVGAGAGVVGAARGAGTRALAKRKASFRLAQSQQGSSSGKRMGALIAGLQDRVQEAQRQQLNQRTRGQGPEDLHAIQVKSKVGSGGFGACYLASYRGMDVALKVIHERSGTEVEVFRNAVELAVLSTLSHPNIVQVVTFFPDVGVRYATAEALMSGAGVPPLTLVGDKLLSSEPSSATDNNRSNTNSLLNSHSPDIVMPAVAELTPGPSTALSPMPVLPRDTGEQHMLAAMGLCANDVVEAARAPLAMYGSPGGWPGGGWQGGGWQGGAARSPAPVRKALVICMEFCSAGTLWDAVQNGAFHDTTQSERASDVAYWDARAMSTQELHRVGNKLSLLLSVGSARRRWDASRALGQHLPDAHGAGLGAPVPARPGPGAPRPQAAGASRLASLSRCAYAEPGPRAPATLALLSPCPCASQNVLLKENTSDPRGFNCKLSDFGLTKLRSPGAADLHSPQPSVEMTSSSTLNERASTLSTALHGIADMASQSCAACVSPPAAADGGAEHAPARRRRRYSGTVTHLPPEVFTGSEGAWTQPSLRAPLLPAIGRLPWRKSHRVEGASRSLATHRVRRGPGGGRVGGRVRLRHPHVGARVGPARLRHHAQRRHRHAGVRGVSAADLRAQRAAGVQELGLPVRASSCRDCSPERAERLIPAQGARDVRL